MFRVSGAAHVNGLHREAQPNEDEGGRVAPTGLDRHRHWTAVVAHRQHLHHVRASLQGQYQTLYILRAQITGKLTSLSLGGVSNLRSGLTYEMQSWRYHVRYLSTLLYKVDPAIGFIQPGSTHFKDSATLVPKLADPPSWWKSNSTPSGLGLPDPVWLICYTI
jgi:hypothetical protein